MTKKVTKAGSISRRRLLTTASAGAVLAVSPFRINLLQAEEAPIKIGFPVPLTGPYGAEAQDQVRAGQLAIAQFNDAGGLNGRKAELVVRDDKLNPGEAATRTLELVEKEKVNFVVGSLSAAVQLAINNVTKERGVIFNSISQSDAINEAADFSKYTFHEALNPHMTSGAVGRYAFTKFGKKVAFLTADYAYGHEMVRGFLEVGKQFNIENLGDIRHPLGTTDFSTLLPRLQALKPDILCISNFGRDQQIALKQATDFGIKKSIQIIAPLLSHASRVAAGPQAFEGVVGGCSFFWGIEDKFASTKAFNDAFRKMYDGKLPTDYGALGYGGVRTVLEAVKGAGSVETDKVVASLEALKYDYYKGQQYYRKCDHQSVQSVLVIKSKSKDMKNESDVFEVLSTEEPDEKNLRSCDALGHKS
ncbi:ABC transporter substrate-binding protein [Bradyrhizobium elkanii]|uniref:ABC transporter substrate-binding protein n=1 Tax=Bradyrhizobium elkanii TaxID=29448 RepID=UPI000841BB7C|nr:ABC transporter substrate-binding protein [Bradyrhizobium elkanii]ODM84315.1 ABC transporter substrate-binding protein [Bradyrhizobium elkanii]ODM86264.1 ABC transporter substrate-binding protein [Bradyrhizobium elkanii]